jgi:hypothetical protein
MSSDSADVRLAYLARVCNELAVGIENAREVLKLSADESEVAHLVARSLAQMGWMADRAAVLQATRRH